MNKNDECYIVKDLATPYVENLINIKSKKFVEKHLQNCNNCKKYYSDITSNIFNEYKNEKNKEEHELDFLKKVRKRMNILKRTLISIILIISIIILSLFVKCQFITKIINNAYNQIEHLKTIDNYKLTETTISKNYTKNSDFETTTNYYYKDGKYKIDNGNSIYFYEDNSYKKIYVYNDLKQIDYYTQNFIETKKGNIFDEFSEIITYKQLPGLLKLGLSTRISTLNGINCYVIRNGNKDSFREIWIDKEKNIVLKRVEEVTSKYCRETIYTLYENVVTDKDIDASILETEQYREYTKNNITYNASTEIKNVTITN